MGICINVHLTLIVLRKVSVHIKDPVTAQHVYIRLVVISAEKQPSSEFDILLDTYTAFCPIVNKTGSVRGICA